MLLDVEGSIKTARQGCGVHLHYYDQKKGCDVLY